MSKPLFRCTHHSGSYIVTIVIVLLLLGVYPAQAGDPVINEFLVNHIGSDTNEFIELFGDPAMNYPLLTLLEIEGVDVPVGPGSTYPMVFIANCLALRVIEMQIEQGMTPEVRKSGNLKGGLERSRKLFDAKYYNRIKHY